MRLRSALGVLLVVAAGLAVYAIRSGLADDPVSQELRPEVEGRLVGPIAGETATGSYEVKCEFDALVDIEGQEVVVVREQGSGAKVAAGDMIAESMYEPDRPGVDSHLESGPLGQRQSNVSVYWGKDGALHAGCAPESIKTEGGISAPLGDSP
jgi:hypothetical protein